MLNEVKHLYLIREASRSEEGFFARLKMTNREVLIIHWATPSEWKKAEA
jgi:hypothetical protein